MSDRLRLLDLIRSDAVMTGNFVLSSGRESNQYIDARRVTLGAEGSRLVGRVLWQMIQDDGLDAVGGLTLGADPIVTAVSLTSAGSRRPIAGLIVRKAPKEHGTGKRVEGPLKPGMTVLVVEDTSTTGASALEAARTLEAEGVTVRRIITVIDREEGAREAIESAGYPFDAVFTLSEIVEPDPPKPESPSGRRLLLQTDGSSVGNPGPSGAGFVLFDEQFGEVRRGSEFLGVMTNNRAEYEALIRGMRAALDEGADDLTVRMDSDLIVQQMSGRFKVKDAGLKKLHADVVSLAKQFRRVTYQHVPRSKNRLADSLSTQASARGY